MKRSLLVGLVGAATASVLADSPKVDKAEVFSRLASASDEQLAKLNELLVLSQKTDITKLRRLAALNEHAGSGRQLSSSFTSDDAAVLDRLWLLVCGFLVMLMQAGFAMLEAGCCRQKNAQSILMKNVMDVCIGTIGWWAVGYSIAYGGDWDGNGWSDSKWFGLKKYYFGQDFLGNSDNTQTAWDEGHIDPIKYGDGGKFSHWFFQWAFCATAATIVSGGVAERVKFHGYAVYSLMMTTLIYPVIVNATWGYGFLECIFEDGSDETTWGGGMGYIDFAGSGVVHMCGGVGALVGSIFVGRRSGRFEDGVDQNAFNPHSMPLVVLGTLILWFGWYGFNPGSTLAFSDYSTAVKASMVAMNTTLCAASGGLTVCGLRLAIIRKYDIGGLCNGILAGLVASCAGCATIESGSAVFIGLVAGIVYQASSMIMQKLKVDDPLDAFSVHGMCGFWGLIAAPLFDFGAGLGKHHGWGGWDHTEGMTTGKALLANLAEALFIIVWSGGLSAIIFGLLTVTKQLRVDVADEAAGVDQREHSPSKAYCDDAAKVEPAAPKVEPEAPPKDFEL